MVYACCHTAKETCYINLINIVSLKSAPYMCKQHDCKDQRHNKHLSRH